MTENKEFLYKFKPVSVFFAIPFWLVVYGIVFAIFGWSGVFWLLWVKLFILLISIAIATIYLFRVAMAWLRWKYLYKKYFLIVHD